MTKIAHLSALERALEYPYDAPDHAYLIKDSQVFDLDPGYDFASRIAVLSLLTIIYLQIWFRWAQKHPLLNLGFYLLILLQGRTVWNYLYLQTQRTVSLC